MRFEDEHLLVVAKPAGVNTHRADTYAQDGMVEWVQRQRPGTSLSVLHRLDKATSGLLLFGKSTAANRALSAQFEARSVRKRYELLTPRDDGRPAQTTCDAPLTRGTGPGGEELEASTEFVLEETGPSHQLVSARPSTGRTHQVRRHAAALGMAVAGDEEHGGAVAARLFLHAARLGFTHPERGAMEVEDPRPVSFDRTLHGDVDATSPAAAALVAAEARAALFDPGDTNAYLWIDRHHDGFPDVRVERLGDTALVLDYTEAQRPEQAWLDAWLEVGGVTAVYQQPRPRGGGGGPARLVAGAGPDRFEVVELGTTYLIDLSASETSSGLFLDQRETRRRLRHMELTGRTVLNAFAHTGALSVAAARAGAETLSLDLSRHYLDRAAANLRRNVLDPADHDFIYGDVLDWMPRLAKRGRRFDLVLVDPPSSSTGRRGSRWSVDRDLHALVEQAAALCAPGGTLFVSTNLRRMPWARFLDHISRGLAAAGRQGEVETQTLPLDHRSGPGDPPYLKAAWTVLDGAGDGPGGRG